MTRGASTESMGGIGPSYERAVAALYLAAMLTGSAGPGLKGKVASVAAQQAAALDDLEIRTEDNFGQTAVMRLQIKHQLALTASASNVNFASVVGDAWRDLQSATFAEGVDRVGAAAERISADSHYGAARLGEMARLAKSGDALAAMLDRPAQGGDAKALWDVVAALSVRPLGQVPTNDQLLRFWQHFVVLRIEATLDRDRDRERAVDQLRAVTFRANAPDPAELFGMLELVAGTLNVRGAGFDADQLRMHLSERYNTHLELIDPQLEPIARTARAAAARDAQAWRDTLKVAALAPEFVPLDPIEYDASKPAKPIMGAPYKLDGIEPMLRRHRGLAVEGVPGAGKTQSLVQIAQHLLEESELVPIVRSLPSLALGRQALLDGIATDPFHTIGRDGLALLARTGRLVLLLDGWNELGTVARDWAWEAFRELKRLYPDTLLVITTRSGTVRPPAAEIRLKLAEFDRDRQIAAAELQHGSEGRQLLIRARAQTNLRPLLRIPLFLTAILAQARLGRLPIDREKTVEQLVDVAKGEPKQRETMRVGLDGQQFSLLEDLAWALMERDTSIEEGRALQILAASLGRLRKSQMLFSAITSPQALDQLLHDSILSAHGDPGSRTIRFSHQLLEEWFASHRIDRMIQGATQTILATLLRIIDAPLWGTAVLFSVERLARCQERASDLRMLVAVTLGIEPFLAAEMLLRMPEAARAPLDPVLTQFASTWRTEQPTRAAAFMLASGRPQFSQGLWQDLAEHGELAFGARNFRHRFRLDALQPGWNANFVLLKSQTRRALLIDIIDQGDPAGLHRVGVAALEDPDADVVSGVIDYLDFHDEGSRLNDLLAKLDEAMGRLIARERRPEAIDDASRARWDSWRKARIAVADDLEWIQLALEFDAAPPTQIVERLLALKGEKANWSVRGFYEEVAERHAATLTETLAERLRRGMAIPFEARPYLAKTHSAPGDLIDIITNEDTDRHKRTDAARVLDSKGIGQILDDLLAGSSDLGVRRDQRRHRLADALGHAQFATLITEVLARQAKDAGQAHVLANALASWSKGSDETPFLPLAPEERIALNIEVAAWTAVMIQDVQGERYRLVALGQLIGRMGSELHVPELLQLIEEDRTRQRRQQEERNSDPTLHRHSEAHIYYDNQYCDSLVRIGGEAVTKALVERFIDPAWEVDAATVLGQLHAVEPRRPGPFGREEVGLYERRASLAERATRPPNAVAAMLLDRIDQLVFQGDTSAIATALKLAGPAMHMDYGNRAASLRALFDQAQNAHRFPDFAKAFAERGELLPAKLVHDQIAREAAAVEAMPWRLNNDMWKFKTWLRLAAFADDPAAALPDAATWPRDARTQQGHQELVVALGYSPAPNAPKALEMLRQADPLALFGGTWVRALAEIGSEGAATVLLDAIETTPADSKQWRDIHGMRSALQRLIDHPSQRARAFRMLETLTEPTKLGVVAGAIVETLTEADAIKLLELVDRPERAVIGRELVGRLENAAVIRVSLDGMSNAYELEGVPLLSFRKRAFELLGATAPLAEWARRCLQAIDELRDQYGKPSAEPNHPDLGAKVGWPTAAAEAWKQASIDWQDGAGVVQ